MTSTPRSPDAAQRPSPRRGVWALLLPSLLCICGLAQAQAQDVKARARIVEEQRLIGQRFDAEERACKQRFAVSACIEDLRVRRRDALAPWRAQEALLDDGVRQQRAAQRQQAVAGKQQAAADRAVSAASAASATVAVPRPARAPPTPPTAARSPAQTARAAAARRAEAAKRAQTAQRLQADAANDRARIAQRLAEREKQGKPVQPLPPFPSAAPGAPASAASATGAGGATGSSPAPGPR